MHASVTHDKERLPCSNHLELSVRLVNEAYIRPDELRVIHTLCLHDHFAKNNTASTWAEFM